MGAAVFQVSEEEAGTVESAPVRMTEPSAAASRHVATEPVKGLLAQTADRNAMSIGPRDEVLRRSQMSAGRDLSVSDFREHVSELGQLRARRTSAQSVNPCGRIEQV